MTIEMHKFGNVLTDRPNGREAFLAIRPILPARPEHLVLDFQGVEVLTPGFADEFVTPLLSLFKDHVTFLHTGNITVRKTLEFLAEEWPEGSYEWKERPR